MFSKDVVRPRSDISAAAGARGVVLGGGNGEIIFIYLLVCLFTRGLESFLRPLTGVLILGANLHLEILRLPLDHTVTSAGGGGQVGGSENAPE